MYCLFQIADDLGFSANVDVSVSEDFLATDVSDDLPANAEANSPMVIHVAFVSLVIKLYF